MSNPNLSVTNFTPNAGVREVAASEQALLTNDTAGALTVLKYTILGRITTSGNYKPYHSNAVDGSQYPVAVSLSEVDSAGNGNSEIGVLLKGRIDLNMLIIQGGNGAGQNITPAICDQLREYEIIVQPIEETNILDNQ